MSEGLQAILNDDGVFEEYDDTYNLTIHCESAEEQEEVLNKLNWWWIPVSERLPEKNGQYLVTVNKGYMLLGLWCGIKDDWINIIAWMPLPEPYKAESEDKNES